MDADLQKPRPGDMIEISRGAYKHWALYVGNGYVIHLTEETGGNSSNIISSGNVRAKVKKELLRNIAQPNKYKVNNKHDDKYDPLPAKEILQKAEKMVGKVMDYSLTNWNCEHFVNMLRYGVTRSDQVTNWFTAANIVGVGLAFLSLIGTIFSRN